jgi:DNA-binding MarR family transcriptional regulator
LNDIAVVRDFNRFYTARLGLLRKRHLDSKFSLTEARILYEIGSNPRTTAAALREVLGLDRGYISHSLAVLSKRRLIRHALSSNDGREKLLSLTITGEKAVAHLNEQSDKQMQEMLADLPATQREAFAEALSRAKEILSRVCSPLPESPRLNEKTAKVRH